jgi:Tol biopolymer transport system component
MSPFDRFSAEVGDRYRLERELGQGGMAIVYLAHDIRHDRPVALKIIRPELSAVIGADRFLQEIKLTAHLQHPHILPLFDSGSAAGLLYYVMPYVAGESLRARLERERQLPLDDALATTRSLAHALDYAHRQGVVHRDIKPENILIQDAHPLLADFGIALALTAAAGDRMTRTGLSLGTPHYMSPEQAAGDRKLDGRTDIYALGCVAYEMMAGVPPHSGPTAQAVIAAVMTADPRPLDSLRRSVPPNIAAAIHRALEKTPADRFSTGAQFAAALAAAPSTMAVRRVGWRWPTTALVALSVGAGLALGSVMPRRTTASANATHRWDLVLPETGPIALTGPGPLGLWQSALALSRDGEVLIYASPIGGTTRLLVRRLSGDTTTVLAGTDGAYYPFFSPDGQWIGFFSGNELRRVPLAGGAPVTLRKVDRPVGATWVSKDSILLMESEGFRMRWVPVGGGGDSTVALSTQFGNPDVLPGNRWALGQLSSGQLALLSLHDGRQLAITRRGALPLEAVKPEDLLLGASPRWVATGHIVFGAGDGTLMALPFDAAQARVLGPPVSLIDGVRIEEGFGYTEYALAREGTLVFVPGANQNYGCIALINRNGTFDTLPFPRGQYTQLRMSPDGQQLALQRRDALVSGEVVVLDMTTGQQRRLAVEGNFRTFPASWAPDGRRLMVGLWDPVRYLSYGFRLYSSGGVQELEVKLRGASYFSIAPNGKDYVYSDWRSGDLFIRHFTGDTTATSIPGRGSSASFSPDGYWLAYSSTDGGIDVSPVPPTGAIYQVAERGQQPLWSPDGGRLIYRDGRRFYEVARTPAAGFRTGAPHLIAEGPFVRTFAWNHSITPNGRLVAVIALSERSLRQLAIVTGFDTELKRLAPPR